MATIEFQQGIRIAGFQVRSIDSIGNTVAITVATWGAGFLIVFKFPHSIFTDIDFLITAVGRFLRTIRVTKSVAATFFEPTAGSRRNVHAIGFLAAYAIFYPIAIQADIRNRRIGAISSFQAFFFTLVTRANRNRAVGTITLRTHAVHVDTFFCK
jgi:hypothetical protein